MIIIINIIIIIIVIINIIVSIHIIIIIILYQYVIILLYIIIIPGDAPGEHRRDREHAREPGPGQGGRQGPEVNSIFLLFIIVILFLNYIFLNSISIFYF